MSPEDGQELSWWKKPFAWLDKENDRVLGYHGSSGTLSKAVEGQVWLPAVLHAEGVTPVQKAVQYCQCQRDVEKTGGVECVTTSAVIARNIVRDELAARQGVSSAPQEKTVKAFVDQLDAAGLGAWNKRLSSGVPVVGGFMHPVLQLPHALKVLAQELAEIYGDSFRSEFTSGNTLDALLDNLQNNRPTLIHGIWNDRKVVNRHGEVNLDPANLLGGSPHTMPLVMYSAVNDEWWFYDLGWKPGKPGNGFYRMNSEKLMVFWGRCYPLGSYTKRFSMTTLWIDA